MTLVLESGLIGWIPPLAGTLRHDDGGSLISAHQHVKHILMMPALALPSGSLFANNIVLTSEYVITLCLHRGFKLKDVKVRYYMIGIDCLYRFIFLLPRSPINLEPGIRLSGTGYLSGIWGTPPTPPIFGQGPIAKIARTAMPHTSQAVLHRLIPGHDGEEG
ncbi:hypothetical protein EMCG_00688 [[Emmonsia] crescens]|uniref:Uncharacterized protein n=1 Tax=[Emmonsia] crescens TaxID=73230 RepID=A0A0G2HQP3_9EURO|nr:hypothetical protein EMCG_00688 [Emmonsia crescens UAMH 3008]